MRLDAVPADWQSPVELPNQRSWQQLARIEAIQPDTDDSCLRPAEAVKSLSLDIAKGEHGKKTCRVRRQDHTAQSEQIVKR